MVPFEAEGWQGCGTGFEGSFRVLEGAR